MITTFDFGDGNGNVPAHRHINPDGSIGGWVAETVTIETTVYIGKNAAIFGYVTVRDKVRIYDEARVFDRAFICNEAKIYGESRIYESASVFGKSEVYEEAEIYGRTNIFNSVITGNVHVYGITTVCGEVHICEQDQIIVELAQIPLIVTVKKTANKAVNKKNNLSIPPPKPSKPLRFNTKDIANIKIESKKISAMLNAIYEQVDSQPVVPQPTYSSVLNLDDTHLDIVKILATRNEWQRDELQKIMKGMMIDGVLEHINDAFFDYCDEAFIEGDDPIEINVKLYKEIFK